MSTVPIVIWITPKKVVFYHRDIQVKAIPVMGGLPRTNYLNTCSSFPTQKVNDLNFCLT